VGCWLWRVVASRAAAVGLVGFFSFCVFFAMRRNNTWQKVHDKVALPCQSLLCGFCRVHLRKTHCKSFAVCCRRTAKGRFPVAHERG
jgi:hypothetical protein